MFNSRHLFAVGILLIICAIEPFTGYAQADVDPNPLTQECHIQLIDPSDKEPLIGAHICVELSNGRKVYDVSDFEGKATLLYENEKIGKVAISSIGYVTTYLQLQDIEEGAVIPVKSDVFSINQVVVTGTNEPTPVDSSIYKVKVISEAKIRQSGSVNLAEVLLTEANIRIRSDLVLGSQIEMLGMSGSNVKIMIDGVPVIGRLNGNVDLSQINMANVKQIEVIEGPMSVVYGNNALAGTINIITKKNSYHDFTAQADAFVESVGRYNGNAYVSKRVGRSSISLDGGYEYFRGVDFDKNTRSMDWKPKNLYRGNINYQYSNNNLTLGGKFGYYHDQLFVKSDKLDADYKVSDSYYYTDRIDFGLNLFNRWERSSLDVVAGYNLYERASDGYDMYLTDLDKKWREKVTSQEASNLMTRAIYSTALLPSKLTIQGGVDLSYETFEGERVLDQIQNIGDYAGFVKVNYSITPGFEIEPGLRFMYNSKYDAPIVYSLNTKWNMTERMSWRASFARGYRAPELKELYYIFDDVNHTIFGNPDLKAEYSYNISSSLDYIHQHDIHSWMISAATYYNTMKDKIDLVEVEVDGKHANVYYNIDEYESYGTNIDINYSFKKNLKIRAGYGLTARYNYYEEINNSDKFNISHDIFGGLSYRHSRSNVSFEIDYKYNGSLPYFAIDSKDNKLKEAKQDAFHTMNTSTSKSFIKNKLKGTLGVKNLFDITRVSRSIGGGGHSSGNGIPISYGRSFFINLIYTFNKL